MGIFQKAGSYYIDYYVSGRRKREKIGTSRKLAETVLAKRKVQVAEGKFLDIQRDEKVTFDAMAVLFLENYAKVNKKSWARDELSIRTLNRVFAGRYLYEINNLDVEEYKRRRLEDGVAAATINRELACLKTILRKAAEWGRLKKVPPRIQLLRENNQRVRYLEPEEARALIGATNEPLKSVVVVALNTGLRRGEILNLKWSDVDLRERNITVRDAKNSENRVVPMNSTVHGVLATLRGRMDTADTGFVFTRLDGRDRLAVDYISHLFLEAAKKAGISDFRFHDLRHAFASRLVMKGVDFKTVQELLGHKDIRMTLRYSHLSRDHKKQAVECLAEEGGCNSLGQLPDSKSECGSSPGITPSPDSGKRTRRQSRDSDGHYLDTKGIREEKKEKVVTRRKAGMTAA